MMKKATILCFRLNKITRRMNKYNDNKCFANKFSWGQFPLAILSLFVYSCFAFDMMKNSVICAMCIAWNVNYGMECMFSRISCIRVFMFVLFVCIFFLQLNCYYLKNNVCIYDRVIYALRYGSMCQCNAILRISFVILKFGLIFCKNQNGERETNHCFQYRIKWNAGWREKVQSFLLCTMDANRCVNLTCFEYNFCISNTKIKSLLYKLW